MRVAQIAPPWIAVPPSGYGGIELVVSLLADGLADRGHEVTLFATGDSTTRAHLDAVLASSPGPTAIADPYLEVLHCSYAYDQADRFDVIHDHNVHVGVALGRTSQTPVVHTTHGKLSDPYIRWYQMAQDRLHLVAISDSQRASAPALRFAGRVYNGIDLDPYPLREDKDDFLLFLGRANRDKGPDVAVEIAKRAGKQLVMAAAIKHPDERRFWDEHVVPKLTGEETILPEISVEEKADLLARASALLFPIRWPEPFGLVMVEANACGTPVIASPMGAAPELIEHGVTGYLSADLDEQVAAVTLLDRIDPRACRVRVERLFSAEAMVRGYEELYQQVTGR